MDLHNDGLKKPWIVNLLGSLFIVSPLFNLIGNLYGQSVERWYSPAVWWVFAHQISFISWLTLILLSVAGVALCVPRKTTWYFAILVIIFVSVYNIVVADDNHGRLPDTVLFGLNIAVLVILYFCRFPYLDRRGFLFIARRYMTELPVTIKGSTANVTLANISKTGALLIWEKGQNLPKPGEVIQADVLGRFQFQAKVVRLEGQSCGVRFTAMDSKARKALRLFISELNVSVDD